MHSWFEFPRANPFPVYARIRADSPVHRFALPRGGHVCIVVRYQDAVTLFTDPRFVKDKRRIVGRIATSLRQWRPARGFGLDLMEIDPPDHTRLRALVSHAFTPSSIQRLQQRIEVVAGELLDHARGRREMDLIADYALPLAFTVITELLGVPLEDRETFRAMTRFISGDLTGMAPRRVARERVAFTSHLSELYKARRREPRDDLLSRLVKIPDDGPGLSEEELHGMMFLLLFAGHATTINLVGNGTLALLRNPDQLRMLRENPGLIESGIEELLRFDGPTDFSSLHYAASDIDLGGVLIPRRASVRAFLASANHDERQFSDPDKLDLTRDARRHLGLGHGAHYCLGASLARLEGKIAITTLIDRMPALRLAIAPETLRWQPHPMIRGLERLPVAF